MQIRSSLCAGSDVPAPRRRKSCPFFSSEATPSSTPASQTGNSPSPESTESAQAGESVKRQDPPSRREAGNIQAQKKSTGRKGCTFCLTAARDDETLKGAAGEGGGNGTRVSGQIRIVGPRGRRRRTRRDSRGRQEPLKRVSGRAYAHTQQYATTMPVGLKKGRGGRERRRPAWDRPQGRGGP